MTLRTKATLIVGCTMLAFVLLAYPILRAILLNSYARLDETHVAERIERFQNALDEAASHMARTAADWAAWDETYSFMQDRDEAYVTSNLVDGTFIALDLNLMGYLDPSGNLVMAKAFDLAREQPVALAFDLPQALPASLLARASAQEGGVSGVLLLPSGAMLFAAHPILPSVGDGPSRGVLVIGRYLDQAQWQHLGELTHLSVSAQPLTVSDLPAEYDQALSHLQTESLHTQILDRQRIAGYAFINDALGQPALILRVDMPRDMYHQGKIAVRYLTLGLVIMGLLFVAAHVILLQREIISPITKLGADVQRIGSSADPSQRLNRSSGDEVAELAHSIDGMLEQIEGAQQAREETEARYRSLFDQAVDAILLIDPSAPGGPTIMDANAAACAAYGYTRQEIVGLPIARIDAPQNDALISDRIRRLLAGEALTFEALHLTKEGDETPFEVSARVIEINGRRVIQAIHRDITERRRLEAQLRQAQKMEAVGQLAGGVAHDFNNLLTVINGYSSLALNTLDPSDALRGDIEEINQAGERAAQLTRQLLAFSRKQVFRLDVLNLNETVAGMTRMLQRLIGERIQLETRFAPDLGSVRADASQIEQVVLNLAVNARDAMPDGGLLCIETANTVLDEAYAQQHAEVKPGRYVVLAVSDNGCGMTSDVQAHLFEPFFTTKGLAKGTGLGLATVYGIVKQSDGHITVYSEPKCGTMFRVYLPRVDEAPEAPRDETPTEISLPQKGGLVLVAEDEATVRGVAVHALEYLGYRVLLASNGAEALALWQQRSEPIALVLTDVIMPEMNGPEMVARLRAQDPTVRVIYMSGYSDVAINTSGLLGDDLATPIFYIQKPFTVSALAQTLREALASENAPR